MKLFAKSSPTRIELNLAETKFEPLNESVVLNRFDCGRQPLNRFIKNKAKKQDKRLEQRVTVALRDGSPNCIGYFALQLGSDTVPDFPKDKLKHLQNHTAFPAVHLSHLAVCTEYQRQGLGRHMLMEVFDRVASISDHAGFYALTLQSYDADSTAFYNSIGFEQYSDGSGQPKMLYPIESILQLVRG